MNLSQLIAKLIDWDVENGDVPVRVRDQGGNLSRAAITVEQTDEHIALEADIYAGD